MMVGGGEDTVEGGKRGRETGFLARQDLFPSCFSSLKKRKLNLPGSLSKASLATGCAPLTPPSSRLTRVCRSSAPAPTPPAPPSLFKETFQHNTEGRWVAENMGRLETERWRTPWTSRPGGTWGSGSSDLLLDLTTRENLRADSTHLCNLDPFILLFGDLSSTSGTSSSASSSRKQNKLDYIYEKMEIRTATPSTSSGVTAVKTIVGKIVWKRSTN